MEHLRFLAPALAAALVSGCSGCSEPSRVCDAGLACAANPGAPCMTGAIACPAATCADAIAVSGGTACGADKVCDGKGACVACSAGAACDAGECTTAAIACGTGAAACAPSGNRGAGAPCSAGVCNGAGSCVACTAGAACDVAECSSGSIACGTGSPVCATAFADAGTTCTGGLCNGSGGCAPDVTVIGTVNLSEDPIAPGRTCADGATFAVASLGSGAALLSETPPPDCLGAGDEVLLINLQGAPDAVGNVGVWEALRVQSISGASVTFSAPKSRFYGDSATGDDGIADGGQKVALVRIPAYGTLAVESLGAVTADAWDGGLGGVVAMRAVRMQIDGQIDARALGYHGGLWSQDDQSCSENLLTGPGESIGGPAAPSLSANFGGGGGTGAIDGQFFVDNEPTASTAGHAQAGVVGNNFNGRDAGDPGGPYGVADGGLLTMGSGAGGTLTCTTDISVGPVYLDQRTVHAGGIIFLRAGSIVVGESGLITAAGVNVDTRQAHAGGSIMLRAATLDLSSGIVSAAGGVTDPAATNVPAAASPGYITIFFRDAVTGTTDPPAFTQQVADP